MSGMSGMKIVDSYTEKSFAVFGNTKPYKEYLKKLGGRPNSGLTLENEKQYGWIFSKKNLEAVQKFIVSLDNTVSTPSIGVEDLNTSITSITSIPSFPTISAVNSYQNVRFKIFLPSVGMTAQLSSTTLGKVVRLETHNDITDTVYIEDGDKTYLAVICRQKWQILGYMTQHTLKFIETKN